MHSPAEAFAWELWYRQKRILLPLAAYLIALTVIRLVIERDGVIRFESSLTFPFLVIIPMAAAFTFFLALFTFGLSGDLAARESMYPRRMFTLPVTSSALAGWPMLYGTITMAALWFAVRALAVWPSDLEMPWLWPALFAASVLAWTQALTWLAYPLRGLRVISAVAVLLSIDVVVITAFEAKASEGVMLALLAPLIPLAYVAARFAVTRARSGEVPDWRSLFTWMQRRSAAAREPFPSPASAQFWLEWRQYGRSLPLLVAIVLPFEVGLLFLFPDTPSIVFWTVVVILFTPAFLSVFVAISVAKSGSDANGSYGIAPFLGARPMSTAGMIGTKLTVTTWSTLVTWIVLLAGLAAGLKWSGAGVLVADLFRETEAIFGLPRAVVLACLAVALPMLSGWKHLVQSLCIGMSGRAWLIKGSGLVALSLATFAIPIVDWILSSKGVMANLFFALPSILAILVACKLLVAGWIVIRLYDARLLDGRALIAGAILWNAFVFALFGLLRWIFPSLLVRSDLLLLFAMLMVPLARLSAAPLALAWNRHR
jgi:hypothetical protein